MEILEVVRLKSDVREVPAGAVGTVVELLDESTVLVDFAGDDGVSYAVVPVLTVQLDREYACTVPPSNLR